MQSVFPLFIVGNILICSPSHVGLPLPTPHQGLQGIGWAQKAAAPQRLCPFLPGQWPGQWERPTTAH